MWPMAIPSPSRSEPPPTPEPFPAVPSVSADTEGTAGNGSGVGGGSDREGDGIAIGHIAPYRSAYRDVLTRFGRIDDVVCRDGLIQGDGCTDESRIDAVGCAIRCARFAVDITRCGGAAGADGAVCRQDRSGNADTEGTAGNGSGVGGGSDREGDGIAIGNIAPYGSAYRSDES